MLAPGGPVASFSGSSFNMNCFCFKEKQTHVADVRSVTGVSAQHTVEEVVVRTTLQITRGKREREVNRQTEGGGGGGREMKMRMPG